MFDARIYSTQITWEAKKLEPFLSHEASLYIFIYFLRLVQHTFGHTPLPTTSTGYKVGGFL